MCFKGNDKYNLLTLTPHSEEDKKAFWKYRCTDIGTMFYAFLVVEFAATTLWVFALIGKPDNYYNTG